MLLDCDTVIISIRAPLAGSDVSNAGHGISRARISIRAPLAGSDVNRKRDCLAGVISIRAPLAGSDKHSGEAAASRVISIRAPLAGSDQRAARSGSDHRDFNPRSPCGERRLMQIYDTIGSEFQSALPLRGATLGLSRAHGASTISIRAPLAGSDMYAVAAPIIVLNFNPRSPCGERHLGTLLRQVRYTISIRAPLAGSDRNASLRSPSRQYFNPRSPCGERRCAGTPGAGRRNFNPRSPCGERRHGAGLPNVRHRISIRAPLAGSDRYIL